MKFLKPIILLIALFGMINSQLLPVPQQEIQLATGLIKGSDLYDSLGLLNCQGDIEFILSSLQSFTSIENKIENFSALAKIFASISSIYEKCPEFESKLTSSLEFANIAYHFPGKFLSQGISELIGFSGIKKLLNLVAELKKDDLTQAGVVMGQILKVFVNSKLNLERKSIAFLAETMVAGSNDSCLDILSQIQVDVHTMMDNLFNDITKVKAALDDFFVQLKNIPSACI